MLENFADASFVANWAEGLRRYVPGLDALHRMTAIVLAGRAPANARVLVLGAGGGMALKAMAEAQPGWSFVGVDPAPDMLRLAERTLGRLGSRVSLVEGYNDDAPHGPSHAATCLLTLHFHAADERTRTIRAIHDRLRPGAPFVAAHGSYLQEAVARDLWPGRYAAFALAFGTDAEQVEAQSRQAARCSRQAARCSRPRMTNRCCGTADRRSGAVLRSLHLAGRIAHR